MLSSIAFALIAYAIFIFFIEDFIKYFKALMQHTYVFLMLCLLCASAIIESNATWISWLLIQCRIGILKVIQGFELNIWGGFSGQFLTECLLVILLPLLPVGIAWFLEIRKAKYCVDLDNKIQVVGYAIGLGLWTWLVMLLALEPSVSGTVG